MQNAVRVRRDPWRSLPQDIVTTIEAAGQEGVTLRSTDHARPAGRTGTILFLRPVRRKLTRASLHAAEAIPDPSQLRQLRALGRKSRRPKEPAVAGATTAMPLDLDTGKGGLVRLAGFEPARRLTGCSGVNRSIHLSYRRTQNPVYSRAGADCRS